VDTLTPTDERPTTPESGKLHVCERACERCLFGTNPYIPWKGHGERLVFKALQQLTHFTCHEHANVMCRGFFNKYGKRLWYVRFASQIHAIKFVRGKDQCKSSSSQ
jgi:hypothetical protein